MKRQEVKSKEPQVDPTVEPMAEQRPVKGKLGAATWMPLDL